MQLSQPWLIGVSKAALSTLRQKYSKILNSIFEISERNARSRTLLSQPLVINFYNGEFFRLLAL